MRKDFDILLYFTEGVVDISFYFAPENEFHYFCIHFAWRIFGIGL